MGTNVIERATPHDNQVERESCVFLISMLFTLSISFPVSQSKARENRGQKERKFKNSELNVTRWNYEDNIWKRKTISSRHAEFTHPFHHHGLPTHPPTFLRLLQFFQHEIQIVSSWTTLLLPFLTNSFLLKIPNSHLLSLPMLPSSSTTFFDFFFLKFQVTYPFILIICLC